MSVPTETDVYLTHNWGNLLPGEEKYDNHERVREVYRRLTARGLSAWFDDQRLHNENIKQQFVEGIDHTKVMIVFITRTYQEKVNSMNPNDFCYFEFNYACLRLTARRMIAVVMEEAMTDQRNWTGRFAAELGSHCFIDMTKAFEAFEQRGDDSLLEAKCQQIYENAQGIIANHAIPGEMY